MRARSRRGFTLVEILVAVMLLALSTAAMITLWTVSRRISERSRDGGETIAVARQETERDKAVLFNNLFIKSTGDYTTHNPKVSDYDANGVLLATNLATNAAATTGAFYRAVSTYSLVTTGSETDPNRQLGIQKVDVFEKSGSGFSSTASFSTTVFYTAAGV